MFLKKFPINPKKHAQAMVEFALVLPILLMVVYGMLEVGRLIFIYSTVVTAAREAMRYGSATGIIPGSEQYKDCAGIKARAQNVDFINSFSDADITISYDHGPGTTSFGPCASSLIISSGDRIIVTVSAIYTPLAGLVPLRPITIHSTSSRTLLGDIQVAGPTPTMAPTPTSNRLIVVKAGFSDGTVTSDISGINCGIECDYNYPTNTVVILTATPISGSVFSGWIGACSGTGTCSLTMNKTRTVWAYFDTGETKLLTLSKSGTGKGTVASNPLGISCDLTCSTTSYAFRIGSSITLTAVANTGSVFTGWSGCDTIVANSCIVNMFTARSVIAYFYTTSPALHVAKTGTGKGTVTSTDGKINCTPSCDFADAIYATTTSVTLNAQASSGSGMDSEFISWGGACSGTATTCTVSVSLYTTVTANFDIQGLKLLTVSKAGTGKGAITSSPIGIDCGATCSSTFANGTLVTLTAIPTPNTGSTFSGWSGDCTGTGSTCTVTMDLAKSVTATFDGPPQCKFTQSVPVFDGTSQTKTISWDFQNIVNGTNPVIDHLVIFWYSGYMSQVSYDTVPMWTGNRAAGAYSIPGGGRQVSFGNHQFTFSFPAPFSIQNNNFNATIYFVPTNCPILTTGSWTVH